MFNIRFTKLKFKLRITRGGTLPRNKESAIRGGMGAMLLKYNCVFMHNNLQIKDCEACSFCEDCIAQRIMYSPFKIKPEYVTRESIGYVIECSDYRECFMAGDELCFNLILFGNVIVYFNQILQAFHALGRKGFGTNKCCYEIVSIENRKGEELFAQNRVYRERYLVETVNDYVEERMRQPLTENRIVFVTPVTLKYRGEFLTEFNSIALVESMVRRNFMLNCFEGNEALKVNFGDDVPDINWQTSSFYEYERYSSTQQRKMPLRGIMGEVVFDLIPTDLLPYVYAAELTHIGKNTSFGFGEIKAY